jgi:RNA polymerase sigma-70 factor (ECF subfamily)
MSQMREDAAAVALARDGDSEAFRSLVERHSRLVFRVAYRMTGNEADAEDVVQETFLRAYRQLGRFESRANFGTWVYRIAVNCAIDYMRSRPKRESAEEDEVLERAAGDTGQPDAEQMLLGGEIGARVQKALDLLSDMERAAFVMRHYQGFSIEEIGRSLGLKTNATKHSIFRAVKKMRVALEPFVES